MTRCLSLLSFSCAKILGQSHSGEKGFRAQSQSLDGRKSQLQEGDGRSHCSLSKEGADNCWRSADILATEAAQVATHLKTLGNIVILLVYLNPHESNLQWLSQKLMFMYLEIGTHFVAQVGMELTMQLTLVLNSYQPSCLCLPNVPLQVWPTD